MSNPDQEAADLSAGRAGEEIEDDRSTPGMDLAAALLLGALSIGTIAHALSMQVHGSIFEAPGMLPMVVGVSMLLMALGLGIKAIRQGGHRGGVRRVPSFLVNSVRAPDTRPTFVLIVVIFGYILAVGTLALDLRWPVGGIVLRFSGFELISIIAIALVLKIFWRQRAIYCLAISSVWILALTAVFRYAFFILLPGT